MRSAAPSARRRRLAAAVTPLLALLAAGAAPAPLPEVAALDPAGSRLVFLSPEGWTEAAAVALPGRPEEGLLVVPERGTAYVADNGPRRAAGGRTIHEIHLGTRELRRSLDLGWECRPSALAVAGELLWSTCPVRQSLIGINLGSGEVAGEVRLPLPGCQRLRGAPGGRRAWLGCAGGAQVLEVDLEVGTVTRRLRISSPAIDMESSPNGEELWVVAQGAREVNVLDLGRGVTVDLFPAPAFGQWIRFTPDGQRALLTAAAEGTLTLYDVAGRRELDRVRVGEDAVPLLVTADGTAAVVGLTGREPGLALVPLPGLRPVRVVPLGFDPLALAWVPAAETRKGGGVSPSPQSSK